MEPITDPQDPRLDEVRDLRREPGRRRESSLDWFVIEGVLALGRAAASGHDLRSVVVTEARLDAVRALALPEGTPLHLVERDCLDRATGFRAHRGVLASATRPLPRSSQGVLDDARRVVFCEAVNDLENLGSIFRAAAALAFDAVLLDPRCADPLYRRCVRVSLGWSTALPFAVAESSTCALEELGDRGLRTVALTPSAGAVPVDEAANRGLLDDPVAVMVGAEGAGLDAGTLELAGHRVAVPMATGVDSLNVATALAVVASFAAARRGWDGARAPG